MIKTVLVPIDFSDCAEGVVEQAATLAQQLNARLTILHALKVPAGVEAGTWIHTESYGSEPALGLLRRAAEKQLPRYRAVAERHGVAVDGVMVEGDPVESILHQASELPADLIVMGTHGRSGMWRALLGSVAEQVMRRATVPLVTVRSIRKSHCEAKSCATCATHRTAQLQQLEAELDG